MSEERIPVNDQGVAAVVELLAKGVCYSDDNIRKAAQEKIEKSYCIPGFCSCLLEIVLSPKTNENTKLLSILTFKNAVIKYWCKRGKNPSILDEEKVHLRKRLISTIADDTTGRIAYMKAFSFAQIVRHDFPQRWQSIFNDILNVFSNCNGLKIDKILFTLHQTLKQVTKKRIFINRDIFAKCTTPLFSFISHQWMNGIEGMLNTLKSVMSADSSPSKDAVAKLSHQVHLTNLLTKCLHRLIVFGIKEVDKSESVRKIFPVMLQSSQVLQKVRLKIPPSNPLRKPISKIICVLARTAIEVQKDYPIPFRVYLKPYMEYFFEIIRNPKNEKGEFIFERLTTQALDFYINIIYCKIYRNVRSNEPKKIVFDSQGSVEAKNIFIDAFKPKISDLVKTIVSVYFPLSEEDLKKWHDDGEKFFSENVNFKSPNKPKTAAISLYRHLLDFYTEEITPMLTEILSQVVQKPIIKSIDMNSNEYQNVILREALLHAFGEASFQVVPVFSSRNITFDSIFFNVFSREVVLGDQSMIILQRRVIWVIGEFVEQFHEPKIWNEVFKMVHHIMSNSKDIPLKMACVNTIKRLTQDINFSDICPSNKHVFNPICQVLLKNANEVRMLDTKYEILEVLRNLVLGVKGFIVGSVETLTKGLMQVWKDSENQNILRLLVIRVLVALAEALDDNSVHLHDLFINILAVSTDFTQNPYMLEDGLYLWEAVVSRAPKLTPSLIKLFERWKPIALNFPGNILICLEILEPYILLGSGEFMKSFSNIIVEVMQKIFNSTEEKESRQAVSVFIRICQMFPEEVPSSFQPCLHEMVQTILHEEKTSRYDIKLRCEYILVISRLLFQAFEKTIMFFKSSYKDHALQILCKLIDKVIELFDNFDWSINKKLAALGLCNIMVTNQREILCKIEPILNCITSAMFALKEDGVTSFSNNESNNFIDITRGSSEGIEKRREKIGAMDPVLLINLSDHFKTKFSALQNSLGQEGYKVFMKNHIPEYVFAQIKKALS